MVYILGKIRSLFPAQNTHTAKNETFLSSKASRPALTPTQPLTHRLLVALPSTKK